jgi:hypothetical protein
MSRFFPILFAFGLAAPGALAQPSALDFARLDTYFGEEPLVEVNLTGSLLRLASAAMAEDEPETSALLDGLDAVTVRIYALSSALTDLDADLADLGHQLEADGWQTFVRVRANDRREGDEPEDVWIYVREAGGDAFGGLVVMALDEDEDQAAFVAIDGLIAPDQIRDLSSQFNPFGRNRDHDEEHQDEANGDDDEN